MVELNCQGPFWPHGKTSHSTVASAINSLHDFHFKEQHWIPQPGGGRKNKSSVIVPGKDKKVSTHAPLRICYPASLGATAVSLPSPRQAITAANANVSASAAIGAANSPQVTMSARVALLSALHYF